MSETKETDIERYQPLSGYRGLIADLELVPRAIRLSFDISGRSSRTEMVMTYVVLAVVAELASALVAAFNRDWVNDIRFWLGIVALLPMPTLLIRRFHDQDRRLGFGIAANCLMLVAVADSYVDYRAGRFANDSLFTDLPVVGAGLVAVGFAAVVLLLMPGTVGPNGFGADPRGRQ